jgi:hypothetical protein
MLVDLLAFDSPRTARFWIPTRIPIGETAGRSLAGA